MGRGTDVPILGSDGMARMFRLSYPNRRLFQPFNNKFLGNTPDPLDEIVYAGNVYIL